MDTTRTSTTIWWILGAIVVLLLIWAAFRNTGAGIPNTGVEDTATSNALDNSTDLYNSGSPATVDESKG